MASNKSRSAQAADVDQHRRVPREDALPNRPTAHEGVSAPTKLDTRSWSGIVKRTAKQVGEDHLTTWAAALTYYAILSMFPGLLLLIAALRLTGPANTQNRSNTSDASPMVRNHSMQPRDFHRRCRPRRFESRGGSMAPVDQVSLGLRSLQARVLQRAGSQQRSI